MLKKFLLAASMILAPLTVLAQPAPIRAVLVSETVCVGDELTVPQLHSAIKAAGYTAGHTAHLVGAPYEAFLAVLSKRAPPPAGTDNLLIISLSDRVLISAMRGTCSLGAMVLPFAIFEAMVEEASGQRS